MNKVTSVEESEGRREFDKMFQIWSGESDMLVFSVFFCPQSPVICRHPEGAVQSGTKASRALGAWQDKHFRKQLPNATNRHLWLSTRLLLIPSH